MATITTLNDGITGASFRGQINTNFSNLNTDKAELSGGTFTGDISVPDEAYGAGWNGSLEVPTKNAVYDEIETKQDTLVSGTNVKTVNGNSIVGSGDIVIASGGDVVGPASSTDNAIARYDATTGKLLQNSGVTIGDTNIISGVDTLNTIALNATGQVYFSNTSSASLLIDGGITFEGATNRRIDDGGSNELIKFPTTSIPSAINEFTISNAAAGSGPILEATGGDTNIDLNLKTKGSGVVKVNGVALSSGTGDVVGPASATDNAIARFDTTTGKLIQNSNVTISDTGAITTPQIINASDLKLNADQAGGLDIAGGIVVRGTTWAGFYDTLGNEILELVKVASPVNEFTISNAATTTGPILSATGGDTNIDININTKGTGVVKINGNTQSGTNTGDQTITNTSDATSHTATLSATGGSLKLVEGANITLTTSGTGADGIVTIASTASGTGDVVGPASATDNGVALFNTTTGKLIKNSTNFVQTATGVGIGTTTPGYSLEIKSASTPQVRIANDGTETFNPTLDFYRSDTDTGQIVYRPGGGSPGGLYLRTTRSDGNIMFQTASSLGGTGSNERMRIDASGNVGIGTTAPATALEIGTTSSINNYVKVVGSNADNTYLVFSGQRKYPKFELVDTFAGGATFNFWNLGGQMRFGTATGVIDTASLTVYSGSNANTQIGGSLVFTNNAAKTISINNTLTDVVGRSLTVSAGGTITGTATPDLAGGALILATGVGTGTGASTMSFQTGTTLTSGLTAQTLSTKMTILGNGNVGIGTTNPAATLHLKAGTATAGTAPIKLTSGVVNTIAESGTFEYDGVNLFFSI